MTDRFVAATLAALLLFPPMAGAEGGATGSYCAMAIERLAETDSDPVPAIDARKRLVAGYTASGEPLVLILQPQGGPLQSAQAAPDGGS